MMEEEVNGEVNAEVNVRNNGAAWMEERKKCIINASEMPILLSCQGTHESYIYFMKKRYGLLTEHEKQLQEEESYSTKMQDYAIDFGVQFEPFVINFIREITLNTLDLPENEDVKLVEENEGFHQKANMVFGGKTVSVGATMDYFEKTIKKVSWGTGMLNMETYNVHEIKCKIRGENMKNEKTPLKYLVQNIIQIFVFYFSVRHKIHDNFFAVKGNIWQCRILKPGEIELVHDEYLLAPQASGNIFLFKNIIRVIKGIDDLIAKGKELLVPNEKLIKILNLLKLRNAHKKILIYLSEQKETEFYEAVVPMNADGDLDFYEIKSMFLDAMSTIKPKREIYYFK
jgi:hypothetical protein